MVYLKLDIQEYVVDERVLVYYYREDRVQTVDDWHWQGHYTKIPEFADFETYDGQTIVIACNSDTLWKIRGMLGGSFGHVNSFPIPVPQGIQVP